MDYNTFIAERITVLLEEHNVTEYALSTQLGRCRSYINKITSCKALPSLRVLNDICDCFHITLGEFFNPQSPGDLAVVRQIKENLKDLDSSSLEAVLMITEKLKEVNHSDKEGSS